MIYIEGFVAAVPATNKDVYRQHAADAAPLFKEFGAVRLVETWGDEVPEGQVTDFRRAVKAKPDEVVVFSWVEYPDKATRDGANQRLMSDPRMKEMGATMPFDAQRMIFGGFVPLRDGRPGNRPRYVDGSLIAVPEANKGAYRAQAERMAGQLEARGALRVVDAWGDDVPDGKVTDYKGAVKAGGDERVVFSWVEWPSKEARNAAWKAIMSDPGLRSEPPPFDERRRVYGGFVPIIDE